MSKRTGPTNPVLRRLIQDLKKKSIELKSPFLKEIAEKLNKPRRQRIEVNLSHIERHARDGETVIVPGVVLGCGQLSKPVTVCAWRFSKPAMEKIKKSRGKVLTIEELLEKNPRGSNVRILC